VGGVAVTATAPRACSAVGGPERGEDEAVVSE
jgi:hypothetical protein